MAQAGLSLGAVALEDDGDLVGRSGGVADQVGPDLIRVADDEEVHHVGHPLTAGHGLIRRQRPIAGQKFAEAGPGPSGSSVTHTHTVAETKGVTMAGHTCSAIVRGPVQARIVPSGRAAAVLGWTPTFDMEAGLSHYAYELLRFVRSSSASLPAPVRRELGELFGAPVIEAYGMTEAAHQMCANPLPPAVAKPRSVGVPTGVDLAVLDDRNRPLPPGERGEASIKGPTVIDGYENNPDADAAAFTGGWFRTGDEGYLDDDGYLFLTGRLKDQDAHVDACGTTPLPDWGPGWVLKDQDAHVDACGVWPARVMRARSNPTAGRGGAHSGRATNKSSIVMLSAAAPPPRSRARPSPCRPAGPARI